MMKKILLCCVTMLMICAGKAQNSAMIWAKNLKYFTTTGTAMPADMVIDNAGNYYITGSFTGVLDMDPGPASYTLASNGNYDMFIAKYDGNGNYIWAKAIGTSNLEGGTGLHVINNILYVTGSFFSGPLDVDPGPTTYTVAGVSGQTNSYLATYDTSGTFQSAFSMPGCKFGAARTDNSGNLVIGGYYVGSVDLDPGPGTNLQNAVSSSKDLFYGKYTPAGSQIWVNVKATTADDYVNDITVSASGLVVTAGSYNYNSYSEITNASGAIQKTGSFGSNARMTAVETDAAGNIFYTGNYDNANDFDWSAATYSVANNGNYVQGFVAKYSPAYTFSWAKQITTVMNINYAASQNIALDNNGDILITFRESHAGSNSWLCFAKLDNANGATIWRNDLSGSCYNGAMSNEGIAIGYRSLDGSVLVTGVIGGSSVGSSTPCSFDADPGTGVYNLNAGVGNTSNRDVFMGKYASCSGGPTGLSAISGSTLQCAGAAVVYSVSPASGASSYNWSLPGGWTGSSTSNTISVTPSASGIISVYASNSCGASSSQTLSVQVNPVPAQPSTISGAVALCVGTGLQTYSVPAVSGATSYSWSVPGSWSGTSTTNTIQVNPGTSGGTISVIVANACGNSPSQNLAVTVNTLPVVSISGPSSVCSGSTTTLNASGATSYTWSTSSNSNSIAVSPSANTTYSVSGTDANGCMNSATKSITVNALPSVTIAGPSAICWASSATLMASGASTYTWSATSSTTNSIAITPSSNTTYTVTGTDANGCRNTATRTVTVNPLPSVAISGPAALCSGSSATLTALGAATYTWSTASNNNLVVISPTVNTTYTLTGTDANGCVNSAIKSVTVNALPSVVISGNTTICAGTNATLTATGATSYTWVTGATTSSVSVSPSSNTMYTVTGTDANGCVGTAGANVVISSTLSIVVNGPSLLCSGSSATLNATGANSYTWSTGATGGSVSVSPTAFTIYTVTGTDVSGCTGTAYKNITVVAPPSVTIGGPSAVCSGNSINLSASGATSYTWSTSATTTSISVSPSSTVTYSVTGVDGNGCSGTANKMITVNPLPPVSVTGPSTVCAGASATIQVSGALSYTWSTGAQATYQVITPFADITYYVYGTDANGCMGGATKSITVSALPALTIGGPSSVCNGSSISLTANGAATYTWNTGSNATSISVSPTVATTYTLRGTSANTCSNTAVRSITVNPLPVVAVSGPTLICKGNTATLTASGANSYAWTTSSNNATVSVSPASTTLYTVNGTDLNGCSKAATFTLSVSPCTGIESWSKEEITMSLYPNPAREEVFIQGNERIQAYSILDVTGRIVAESAGLNTEVMRVDLQRYESGMYMIVIYTGNSVAKLKFIKE